MAEENPVIIIGSGLAGYNVAREYRKLNTETSLTIIADDGAEFYSKPMLSNALAKNKTAAELANASADKMAADLNATILKHTRVEKINPDERIIHTQDNQQLSYSRLVLAVGASAIRIPFAGNATDKILMVNDLESYARFREAISNKKKIVIIGGGLIGCEFANDLVNAGYEVSVLDIADLPLSQLLPKEAGEYLRNALEHQGVNWLLGKKTQQINYADSVFSIELESGESLEADIVLSAVGLRPNIAMAKDAGLEVNRGIVVNRNLETSHKDIYALGDCVEVEGLFLPYVMPLMNAARALAKNLNNEHTQVIYPAMPVMVKTPACPVVVSPPATGIEGEWNISQDDEGVNAQFIDKNGLLQGFALIGSAVADKQKLTKQLPAVLS